MNGSVIANSERVECYGTRAVDKKSRCRLGQRAVSPQCEMTDLSRISATGLV